MLSPSKQVCRGLPAMRREPQHDTRFYYYSLLLINDQSACSLSETIPSYTRRG